METSRVTNGNITVLTVKLGRQTCLAPSSLSGSVVATWPSSAKGEWRVSSWLAKLTRGKNTIFFHMRSYGFSQGRKSFYNTAVYVIKCFISNIRKNSAIDISPAKLSIGWFALGGEREIREAGKSGVWRNQRRKSGPWWKRSTRNGRQRSFSPLTRPSKCRVGRWGAILFHSSYNARVFRCEAPSKQHEWNRIMELCFREPQKRQMATGFLVSGRTNGG